MVQILCHNKYMTEKEKYIDELEHLLRHCLWMFDYLAMQLPGRIPDEEVARIRDLTVTIARLLECEEEQIARILRAAARYHFVCPPEGS